MQFLSVFYKEILKLAVTWQEEITGTNQIKELIKDQDHQIVYQLHKVVVNNKTIMMARAAKEMMTKMLKDKEEEEE